MVLELVLPFECGAAVGAGERTSVRVDHHVLHQGLLNAERLVALGTLVGLLACRNRRESQRWSEFEDKTAWALSFIQQDENDIRNLFLNDFQILLLSTGMYIRTYNITWV